MVVIDPRRTETAELADYHLQVRPGSDAFCLAALLGILVEEDLLDDGFVAANVSGIDAVLPTAEALGIQLLVEPEPDLLMERTSEIKPFVEAVQCACLRINFDIGHFFCAGEDPAVAFESMVGENMTVRLPLPTGETRYFNSLDVWTLERIGAAAGGAPPDDDIPMPTEPPPSDDDIPF